MSLQMTKQGDIDWGTVGRLGLGGALLGGGAAGIVSLIHAINLARLRAKEEHADSGDVDANTIVLRVPEKSASDLTKRADWPTMTASALAALVGTGAMYSLVNHLYHKQVMKSLKADEEAARTQMLTDISGGAKEAFVNSLFDEKLVKEASTGYIDVPLSLGALLAILSTSSVGYATKKILDAKLKGVESKDYNPPKVHRVVLQSAPSTDKTAEAISDADRTALRAAIAVSIDAQLPEPRYSKAAQALLESMEASVGDLVKLAEDNGDGLFSFLCDFPKIAEAIDELASQELDGPMRTARMLGLRKSGQSIQLMQPEQPEQPEQPQLPPPFGDGEVKPKSADDGLGDLIKEPIRMGDKLIHGDIAGVVDEKTKLQKSIARRILDLLGLGSKPTKPVEPAGVPAPVEEETQSAPAIDEPAEKVAGTVGKAVLGGALGAAGFDSISDMANETIADSLAEGAKADAPEPLPETPVDDSATAEDMASRVEVDADPGQADKKAIIQAAIVKAIRAGKMNA